MEKEQIAPWWHEGGRLWITLPLDKGDLFIFPKRRPQEKLEVVQWEVPLALSELGHNEVLKVIAAEAPILRTGWAVVKGKLQLDAQALAAKERLDEFFALLMKHPDDFVDTVETAEEFLLDLKEREWAYVLQQEGDFMLAVISLEQACLERNVKIVGDLSETLCRLGWDKTLI